MYCFCNFLSHDCHVIILWLSCGVLLLCLNSLCRLLTWSYKRVTHVYISSIQMYRSTGYRAEDSGPNTKMHRTVQIYCTWQVSWPSFLIIRNPLIMTPWYENTLINRTFMYILCCSSHLVCVHYNCWNSDTCSSQKILSSLQEWMYAFFSTFLNF